MPASQCKIEQLLTRTEPWLFAIARVSEESQVDALPAQKKRLVAYASLKELPFAYEEFDESAYKTKRPEFRKRVIEPILKAQGLVIVVFDKIDRFSRDASSEERTLFNRLRRQGKIEIHFPSDNLFVHRDSPAPDLFRMDIGLALSSYYSGSTRDNVMRKFEEMTQDNGEFPGKAPIGYLNIDTGIKREGKERTIKDIRPNPTNRELVVEAFQLRARGLSYGAITRKLREKGFKSSLSGRPIPKRQVTHVLMNPFYAGFMRYRGEIYRHKYEPLIPLWLWRKVQEVDKERGRIRTKHVPKEFIFRDVRCTTCGYSVSTDGPKKGGNYYLKCTEYGGKHGIRWVNQKIPSQQVAERILARIRIPEPELPKVIEDLERDAKKEARYHSKTLERLRKERDLIDEEIKDMYLDRRRFEIREDLFKELVTEKSMRQAEIDEEITKMEEKRADFAAPASQVVQLAAEAPEIFLSDYASTERKGQLIRHILSNLTWDGENINFELKKTYAAVAACLENNFWGELPSKFRTECKDEIHELAQEADELLKGARADMDPASNEPTDVDLQAMRENIPRKEPSEYSAQVRAWARSKGYAVPVRGRLPNRILDAYERATK